jgi:hypothetical protein
MPDNLFLVIDISGSMKEMSKILISRNLVSFIREKFRMNLCSEFKHLKIFTWNDKFESLSLDEKSDLPFFDVNGKSDINELINGLVKEIDSSSKVIIFSDGYVTDSEIKKFHEFTSLSPNNYYRFISIGSDADIFSLKKLSPEKRVYLPENINSALKNWQPFSKEISFPSSISQIEILEEEYLG